MKTFVLIFAVLFTLALGQCLVKECFNGGTCNERSGSCDCRSGYRGVDCSIKDCGSRSCHFRGGTCEPNYCSCNSGWLGNACAYRVCGGIPCYASGGDCVDNVCQCRRGFAPRNSTNLNCDIWIGHRRK